MIAWFFDWAARVEISDLRTQLATKTDEVNILAAKLEVAEIRLDALGLGRHVRRRRQLLNRLGVRVRSR